MTTVAFKDGQLAADTLANSNGNRICHVTKIYERNGVLIAGSGSLAQCQRFWDWARTGMKGEPPAHDEEHGYEGALIWDDHILLFTPIGIIRRPTAPFWATGSGWELAMGAMAAGATAREAVEIAAEVDLHTGYTAEGGITVLHQRKN